MNIEEFRDYCLYKPGAAESFPFDDETLVFKVNGKIFAILSLSANDPSINLKCDPSLAIELRETYACVQPGYHMNKKHWNTIVMDGSANDAFIKKWVDHSYQLVLQKIPKKNKSF
jgi:predicted DNA-binding protein (MmcQ/YjbR family)